MSGCNSFANPKPRSPNNDDRKRRLIEVYVRRRRQGFVPAQAARPTGYSANTLRQWAEDLGISLSQTRKS